MNSSAEQDVRNTATAWDRAMTTNDVDAIGRHMADDWVIVGTDGGLNGKSGFLSLIASGELTHDVMDTQQMEVRVYAHTAVTVAVGLSGGRFRGEAFLLKERSSCVFVKQGDTWRCVHTHLSPLDG